MGIWKGCRSRRIFSTTTDERSRKAIRSKEWNGKSGGRKSIAAKVAKKTISGAATSVCRQRRIVAVAACVAVSELPMRSSWGTATLCAITLED